MIRFPIPPVILRASLFAGACLTGFLVAGPVAGALAGGGGDDGILRACYVPGSGVIYRIGADGLGEACKGKNHVEFSWNAEGPPGPRGPTGPQGPPGPGLAAQSCPTGEFVTGIDADGALICSGGAGSLKVWYLDFDGDGFGDPADTTEASEQPAGYVAIDGDCDDSDASIHPGADDPVGDGIDSDCDGFDGTAGTTVDDGPLAECVITPGHWYPDGDGDGVGDGSAEPIENEINPDPGLYVENGCDCDDTDASIHPGADEVVDGVDNNCNGTAY